MSKAGDPLERLSSVIDFGIFREELDAAIPRSDGVKGGRLPMDAVMMFRVLVLQAPYGLSDAQAEFQIMDRRNFGRFLGIDDGDRAPDETTIWRLGEALVEAGAVDRLFARFDAHLKGGGYLAMGSQIVDASIIAAPRQRMTDEERAIVKGGGIPEDWRTRPAKLVQKDRDARWTLKRGRRKSRPEVCTDQTSLQLSALRLAPFQVTTFAHALTSGLPTMDGVLSGDLIDPDGAGAEFSEALIRLPNLGFAVGERPVDAEAVSRSELGIADDSVVYWCGQSLYKYHPADDHIFAEIAERVPGATFLFSGKVVGEPALVFEERMSDAFLESGLRSSDFCVYEHAAGKERYYGLCALADIVLDTPRWSGLATTIDVLRLGIPVVTLPCELSRSRFTAGILRMIGIPDTIATDARTYVDLAVRLGLDRDYRLDVSKRIARENVSIYDDPAPIASLERILAQRAAEHASD